MQKLKLILTSSAIIIAVAAAFMLRETKQNGAGNSRPYVQQPAKRLDTPYKDPPERPSTPAYHVQKNRKS